MSTATTHRVLAVADWGIDPGAVADALLTEADGEPTAFGLLVPATLPGLAWIGDPNASRPCAERQLAELQRLARERGLTVETALVGDPEPVSAAVASLDLWDADRVLVLDRRPERLVRRLRRKTGRRIAQIAVAPQVRPRRRRSLMGLAAGLRPQCEIS
jgi:hypothetical protein